MLLFYSSLNAKICPKIGVLELFQLFLLKIRLKKQPHLGRMLLLIALAFIKINNIYQTMFCL